MTSPPPELPHTRLTRGWRRALYEEDQRRRDRNRRLRRSLFAFAAVDFLIVVGILLVVYRVTNHHTTQPASTTVELPAFVTGAARRALAPTFVRAARESHVPVALLMALTWRESEWENDEVSTDGAVGIGQLLPATSGFVARELLHDPGLDPGRPDDNIRLTARYLAELIREFGGSQRLGVGAYLQGSTSVRGSGLTIETIAYVNQINALRAQFTAAQHHR